MERGEPVTVVCCVDSAAEQAFAREGLEVIALPPGGSRTGDAWRLRKVLREKFIEVVFLHTEREQLVASSAMRLAERGAVIRRVPAGGSATSGRTAQMAGKMATSRLLFSTDEDRARAAMGDRAFLAPLGVDVAKVEGARPAARAQIGVKDETQLIVCVVDRTARTRVTTAMRTIALLADRHPE